MTASIITPKFRVSFPSIFEPKSFDGGDAKYTLTMLFDKDQDLSELKALIKQAAVDKWGADVSKHPKNLRYPIRDADKEDKEYDGYEGKLFIGASSNSRPGLVDKTLKAIINPDDFYAGCYARAEVVCFAYDNKGNKGVSFGLYNVQKLEDGDSFSGKKAADKVFSALEADDSSSDNTDDDSMWN